MKMRPFDFFVVRDKGSAVLEKFQPMEQIYPKSWLNLDFIYFWHAKTSKKKIFFPKFWHVKNK